MRIELNEQERKLFEKLLLDVEQSIREGCSLLTLSDLEKLRSKIMTDEIVIRERKGGVTE